MNKIQVCMILLYNSSLFSERQYLLPWSAVCNSVEFAHYTCKQNFNWTWVYEWSCTSLVDSICSVCVTPNTWTELSLDEELNKTNIPKYGMESK